MLLKLPVNVGIGRPDHVGCVAFKEQVERGRIDEIVGNFVAAVVVLSDDEVEFPVDPGQPGCHIDQNAVDLLKCGLAVD